MSETFEALAFEIQRRATIRDWLAGLYGSFEGGLLTITRRAGRNFSTAWVELPALDRATDVVVAARGHDVWLGVGSRRERLPGRRGGDDDCAAFPGLWADIDVRDADAHKGATDLPASFADARALVEAFPLPPTAVVNTGHGLQAWWCFAEPVAATDIGPILDRWEATWVRLAGHAGWSIDNVWDEARMLRVPGTDNHKLAMVVPVTVEAVDWTRRYGLDDLDGWLDEVPPPSEPRDSNDASGERAGRGDRPGDRWAADHPWAELLASDGATYFGQGQSRHGAYKKWCRPGVDDHHGGTVNYGGSDRLKVFSDQWVANGVRLPAGSTYSRFGYYAATRHGGDYAAAARALAAEGYGRPDTLTQLAPANRGNGQAGDRQIASEQPKGGRASVTLNALLAGDDLEYDWLVPGLLERGDRAVITGDEGWGKSTLLRQIGLGAAAGINPFAGSLLDADHKPLVVLAVDCENSTRQLRREFPKVQRALDPAELAEAGARYHVAIRTEGLVLDQPKDPTGDRAWLEAEIAEHRPDVLLIGPLYKLMGGNPNDEAEARMLALYLDRLRGTNAQMAVVIEAHAPHGQKRPYGWSGWKRWPEFGLHLSDDGSVTPFRGGRDDSRHWPRHLRRGRDREWPWMPTDQPAASASDPEDEYDARVRQVVQRVLDAHRGMWLSQADIIDRAGRRKAAVVKALCHYRDNGWLLTASEERAHGAVTRPTEVYRLDPKGPAGDHNA